MEKGGPGWLSGNEIWHSTVATPKEACESKVRRLPAGKFGMAGGETKVPQEGQGGILFSIISLWEGFEKETWIRSSVGGDGKYLSNNTYDY